MAGQLFGHGRREERQKKKRRGNNQLKEIGTNPGIFPVDVNAVKAIRYDEVGNVGCHSHSVRSGDALAEDGVGAWTGREIPAAKGQDSGDAFDVFELFEFVRSQIIADLDLVVGRQRGKREMHMRIL